MPSKRGKHRARPRLPTPPPPPAPEEDDERPPPTPSEGLRLRTGKMVPHLSDDDTELLLQQQQPAPRKGKKSKSGFKVSAKGG